MVLPLLLSAAAAAAAPGADARAVVVAYALELRVDREALQLTGHERVTLRGVAGATRSVSFPRNGIAVGTVTDARGTPLTFDATGDAIAITLGASLARGATTAVVIDYSAHAPGGVDFAPDAVSTAFNTCHWMVCHEEPGERASFELTLVAPRGLTSIASGTLVAMRPAGVGWERHRWRETRPYPAYLFGFALGDFRKRSERYRGLTLEYYAAASLPETALPALAAPTHAAVDFVRERAGRPLPHGYYRQVVVPGSAAQEVSSYSLLGWDGLEPMLADPHEDWLITHELAHQYWGNLLTCADWSHFWLNEGLTTYLVAAYKQEHWGAAAYEHELALFRARRAKAADAGFDKPLTFPGPYPSLSIKRAVVYSKGALFLAALRAEVGDRDFWKALRAYTRAHQGSVTSRDFQQAFERVTRRDLARIFADWVY